MAWWIKYLGNGFHLINKINHIFRAVFPFLHKNPSMSYSQFLFVIVDEGTCFFFLSLNFNTTYFLRTVLQNCNVKSEFRSTLMAHELLDSTISKIHFNVFSNNDQPFIKKANKRCWKIEFLVSFTKQCIISVHDFKNLMASRANRSHYCAIPFSQKTIFHVLFCFYSCLKTITRKVLSTAFDLQKTCQFIAKMQMIFFGNNFDVLKRAGEQKKFWSWILLILTRVISSHE